MSAKRHSPLSKYRGRWVALAPNTDDQVIASGKTFQEAYRAAIQLGRKDAVLYLVPDYRGVFIGRSFW